MITFPNKVKVNNQDPTRLVIALTDLFDQITSQIGTIKEIAEMFGLSVEDLKDPEIRADLLTHLKEDKTERDSHFDYEKLVELLFDYLIEVMDGKNDSVTFEGLAEEMKVFFEYFSDTYDKFSDFKTHFVEIARSLVKKYPENPYGKLLTQNGDDFGSMFTTLFGCGNTQKSVDDLKKYFEEYPACEKFWLNGVGRVIFKVFSLSLTNLVETSEADQLDIFATLYASLFYAFADPDPDLSQGVLNIIMKTMALVSYSLEDKWDLMKCSLQKTFDLDDEDSEDEEQEGPKSLTNVTYQDWLASPNQYNQMLVSMIKNMIGGCVNAQKEMENQMKQLTDTLQDLQSMLEGRKKSESSDSSEFDGDGKSLVNLLGNMGEDSNMSFIQQMMSSKNETPEKQDESTPEEQDESTPEEQEPTPEEQEPTPGVYVPGRGTYV